MAKRPTAEHDEEAALKEKSAERLATLIGVSVMAALGQPENFFRVSVVRLWENHYRVNVQTGADLVTLRVAHSFFIAADEHGNIVESSPTITRRY